MNPGFVCVYVCVCVYIYIYKHTHTYICTQTLSHTYAHILAVVEVVGGCVRMTCVGDGRIFST